MLLFALPVPAPAAASAPARCSLDNASLPKDGTL